MYTDSEKIKKYRKEHNMTQSQLADAIGVKQQLIAMIESGSRKAPDSVKLGWLKAFNIDFDSQDVLNQNKQQNNVVAIPFYHAPVAAGKGEEVIENPCIDSIYFDKRWLENVLCVKPETLFLVYAKGDSMDSGFNLPTDIHDGDLLLVDSSFIEGNGKTFVILINNQELRVKRLFKKLDGTLRIASDNKKYKEEIYVPNERNEIEIKVLGRVVWNGSKENI